LELSRSTWLITSLSPGAGETMSKYAVRGGDSAGLLARFAAIQEKARRRTGQDFPIIVIQEAGLDGFWIHRVLERGPCEPCCRSGLDHDIAPAPPAKTDRIDGEALVRALLADHRGEPRVCAMRQVPRPEADDRRQGSRALKTLTAARVGIVNRIKGLLFAQGVSSDAPRRRDRRAELEPLRTGDRRPLPPHLKRRIVRESDRRERLLEHIKAVKAECDALLAAAQQAAILNPATMLIELKGIGPEFATVLWQEG
jgi:transposase